MGPSMMKQKEIEQMLKLQPVGTYVIISAEEGDSEGLTLTKTAPEHWTIVDSSNHFRYTSWAVSSVLAGEHTWALS